MYCIEAVRLLLGVLSELWLLLCLLCVLRQEHKRGFMQKNIIVIKMHKSLAFEIKGTKWILVTLKQGSESKNKRKSYVKTLIEDVFIY